MLSRHEAVEKRVLSCCPYGGARWVPDNSDKGQASGQAEAGGRRERSTSVWCASREHLVRGRGEVGGTGTARWGLGVGSE